MSSAVVQTPQPQQSPAAAVPAAAKTPSGAAGTAATRMARALARLGIPHSNAYLALAGTTAEEEDAYESSEVESDADDDDYAEDAPDCACAAPAGTASEPLGCAASLELLDDSAAHADVREPDHPLADALLCAEDELVDIRRPVAAAQSRALRLARLYRAQILRLRDALRVRHRRHAACLAAAAAASSCSVPEFRGPPILAQSSFAAGAGGAAGADRAGLVRPAPRRPSQQHEMQSQQQGGGSRLGCAVAGCAGRVVPATSFCFAHILRDPKQKLFRPCAYVGHSGAQCTVPVMVTQNPPLCAAHLDPNCASPSPSPAPQRGRQAGALGPGVHVLAQQPPQKRRRVVSEEEAAAHDRIADMVTAIQSKRHRLWLAEQQALRTQAAAQQQQQQRAAATQAQAQQQMVQAYMQQQVMHAAHAIPPQQIVPPQMIAQIQAHQAHQAHAAAVAAAAAQHASVMLPQVMMPQVMLSSPQLVQQQHAQHAALMAANAAAMRQHQQQQQQQQLQLQQQQAASAGAQQQQQQRSNQ
eukprot:m51a1_g5371 hypothetical protein (528) ;mRNA; r:529456-531660